MEKPAEECRKKVSELQRRLAQKATDEPEHRFTHLYDLLTWPYLLDWAFDRLMSNRGTRTAGIDGMGKKAALDNRERILRELRAALKDGTYRPQPVRRVYIPKNSDPNKLRPLGIPTITDRLVQMMVKAILEPVFESDFLPQSHGFRPGLSCHTAMAHLHLATSPRVKKMFWTIEGDIRGCFDHVQHKILMRLLKRRIQDAKLLDVIWRMLRAGVMEGELFQKTEEGTPQGGIVSPLLANIYLHELDRWMKEHYTGLSQYQMQRRRRRKEGNAFYVRYADDFVIAWNGPRSGAEQLKHELGEFLGKELGLELSEEKTRITHVTKGYDFLGFTVRRVGKRRGKDTLLLYPSKASVMKLKRKIKAMTKKGTTLPSARDKIRALNYLLRGWANYFCHASSSRTFSYVGHYAFRRMEHWLRKKTKQRGRRVHRQYYRRHEGQLTWVSGGVGLYHPGASTRIQYLRCRYRPNPYLNPREEVELPYHQAPFSGQEEWRGDHSYGEEWTGMREQVLQRDRYCCRLCGSSRWVEVHHVRKHKRGQRHDPARLITLCASCHQQMRNPRSAASRQLARLQSGTGEPDEAKVSRPVREEA